MLRTKSGQARHDKKVAHRLDYYKKLGATFIRADLPGKSKPPKIKGRIPDIYVRINGRLIVEEIETQDTIKTDESQINLLKKGTRDMGGNFKVILA
jgi:hypothetical protein